MATAQVFGTHPHGAVVAPPIPGSGRYRTLDREPIGRGRISSLNLRDDGWFEMSVRDRLDCDQAGHTCGNGFNGAGNGDIDPLVDIEGSYRVVGAALELQPVGSGLPASPITLTLTFTSAQNARALATVVGYGDVEGDLYADVRYDVP